MVAPGETGTRPAGGNEGKAGDRKLETGDKTAHVTLAFCSLHT